MVNVITQLFKYMVALIMAIYTIRCFTVFSVKKEKKKRRIYRSQNFLMLWIHLMLYTIIFLNENPCMYLSFTAHSCVSLLLRCLCTTIFTGMRQSF